MQMYSAQISISEQLSAEFVSIWVQTTIFIELLLLQNHRKKAA